MAIERDLAMGVLATHPLDAARVLETLPVEDTARFLEVAPVEEGAAALLAMHGPTAAAVLLALVADRASALVEALPLDVASNLLRRLPLERCEALLEPLGVRPARSLRQLLRFRPHTAGALMDPGVLAVPADRSVDDVLAMVREAARDARYNVYTVDREQRLVGVFNLRELFLAGPQVSISSIAHGQPHRLSAEADRHAIVSHPGWRQVHALPVVDGGGVYLGALRYRTLRRIEEELRGPGVETAATARALGDLFRTGASSLLEAVAASLPAGEPGGARDGD